MSPGQDKLVSLHAWLSGRQACVLSRACVMGWAGEPGGGGAFVFFVSRLAGTKGPVVVVDKIAPSPKQMTFKTFSRGLLIDRNQGN